jgi:hypothetical protein
LLQIIRNFYNLVLRALGLIVPDQALHRDDIDDALELIFEADRNLQRDGISTKAGND